MNNDELISNFVSFLRSERGLSANTISAYQFDLRDFEEWVKKPLVEVGRLEVQKYLSDCRSKGMNAGTIGRRISSLRSFYQFLLDEDEVTANPTRNLSKPKKRRPVPKTLTEKEVDMMVVSLGDSELDLRDKAMLLTFFASGLRESELVKLKVEDLDLDAGVAKVWSGKGSKDGLVPLNSRSVRALKAFLAVRPVTGPMVFPGRGGRPMSRQGVWWRVSQIAKETLHKRVSPHHLRHAFATSLVEGGADIRDVQALMRHSSVDTTQIYLHTDLTYLRKVYYASHPRARIA